MDEPAITLEICVDTVASALAAYQGGAHRIELCAALPLGGLTPSTGTIAQVREQVPLPIQVLIRPRSGDFCYSPAEFAVMRHDIQVAKEMGATGVVLGLLQPDGHIDLARTQELVALANPMQVTFHRAFDMCADPFQALQELIELKVDRLLTSGQAPKAAQGSNLIALLIQEARGRITVMPGAGIQEDNILDLIRDTEAKEVHLSLSQKVESSMAFRRPLMHMGGKLPETEYETYQADATRIRELLRIIDAGSRN